MRVAYVCLDPGVPVFGRKGSSVHCQEVLRAFRDRGFAIELLATRLGSDVPEDLKTIRCYSFPRKFASDPAIREMELQKLNHVVEQLLENLGPFDLVYERFSLWSYSAMQFAKRQGIPGILEVNSPLIDEQKEYRDLIDEPGARECQDVCFRNASSIIAVSDQVADRVRETESARFKTRVIPNGVNCDRFQSSRPAKTSGPVIGFVGTLKPWHGVSVLLDSFPLVRAHCQDASLVIVGSGPEEQDLRDRASRLPPAVQSAIYWTGAVPNCEMPKILSTFDIAVAPYPELSGFYFSPLKILEYMASGKAVVASEVGQIRQLIQHGETGLLTKPGCALDLASALTRLCHDSDARQQLGKAARDFVEADYSWKIVVDRILAEVSWPVTNCGAK